MSELMPKFDYKRAREEIAQINAIVETCPEAVKEKCFELLFAAVFDTKPAVPQQSPEGAEAPTGKQENRPDEHKKELPKQKKKLPSNILAFSHRYDVSPKEIEKLFLLDHEPILPIYKIPTGKTSNAQMCKVMMVLLENGLLNNQLSAPYPELRESVKEDGFYDGNFNGLLKRNHGLFKGAITKDTINEGEVVELTGAGLTRLAEIVKELGQ
jgi:hypothetical protein